LFTFIKTNFTLPETLDSNFTGEVTVLFEVDKDGAFKIIFTEASHPDIKEEFTRIFEALPKITPASYNGVPTFVQYSVKTTIPIEITPPYLSQLKTQPLLLLPKPKPDGRSPN